MDAAEASAATSAKIIPTDDTMKVERTVALRDLNEGMEAGLRDLVAEHEKSAFEPVRLDPGPPPVMLTLSDLRLQDEAQQNAYQRMDEIFQQAKAEQEAINRDLRGELVAKMKQDIKRAAMERVREFFGPMAQRAATAQASMEFYQRAAVIRRARFDKSDQVHYAATSSWVARLNACPALFLSGFGRDAVVAASPALASLVLEAAYQRSDVDDRVRHSVEAVIPTLKLPEADEGQRLIASIINTKALAESAMRTFQTGRPDALSKISMGIHARAD